MQNKKAGSILSGVVLMCFFATSMWCQAQGYTREKLDVTAESLPESYKGQEPAEVSAAVLRLMSKRSNLQKDEFETTEEFERRTKEASKAPVLGGLAVTDFFALQLYPTETLFVYDADKGILKMNISAEGVLKTIPVTEQKEKVTDVYQGQNTFGAKVNVTKIERICIGLSWQNTKDFGAKDRNILESFALKQELPMPLEVARNTKAHLRILAVFQLFELHNQFTKDMKNLYGGIQKDYKKATVQSPFEIVTTYYLINAKISEFWLYNEETGEILKKIRLPGK